jgi:CDP-paratose synthetase
MKILLTGATGSIGRELTNALVAKGFDIAIIVRDISKAAAIFTIIPAQSIEIINYRDSSWANQVAKFSPEIVIHLAAFLTSRDDVEVLPNLINSNITFGAELLQSLRETSLKVFINTGTFAEYFYGDGKHNPSYLYAATKTAFHSILKYYQQVVDFKVVNVIPYTVYGQLDTQPKIIDIIYNSFFSEIPVNMSSGQQTLDFIHITDVVAFYCLLIEQQQQMSTIQWEDYHLGTGQGSTLRDIAQLLSNKLGLPENISWGALPYRTRDTMYSVAPLAKLINHFNWKPSVDIENGINKFLADK